MHALLVCENSQEPGHIICIGYQLAKLDFSIVVNKTQISLRASMLD